MSIQDGKSKKVQSLSSQILDYYQKYGKNRDLEKYLRRNYNKSSSEGSLDNSLRNAGDLLYKCPLTSLSMGNLEQDAEIECNKRDILIENMLNPSETLPPNKLVQPQSKSTERAGSTCEISIQTKDTKEGQKRSYNFNCESNIAISLPLQSIIASNELQLRTQGAIGEDKKMEEMLGTTLDAGVQTEIKNMQTFGRDTRSNKRLEWDSLGDVGYNKPSSNSKEQTNQLSSVERNVLKNFFSERGILISFTENNGSEMRNNHVKRKENTKERWRTTLENIKQKYSSPAESSANSASGSYCLGLSTYGNAYSTPKSDSKNKENLDPSGKTAQLGLGISKIEKKSKTDVNKADKRKDLENDLLSSTSFEYIAHDGIRSDSDKENVSTTNSTIKSNKECAISVDVQPKSNDGKELELGIKLLCTLIETKGLCEREKMSLVKKIVRKISRSNFPSSEQIGTAVNIDTTTLIGAKSANGNPFSYYDDKSAVQYCNSTLQSFKNEISSSNSEKHLKETVRSRHGSMAKAADSDKTKIGRELRSSRCEYISDNTGKISGTEKPSIDTQTDVPELPQKNFHTAGFPKEAQLQTELTMHEWLEPLTASEIRYDKNTAGQPSQVKSNIKNIATVNKDKVMEYLEKEKNSHLNWIESEIEHLKNLKDLLLEINNKDNLLNSSSEYKAQEPENVYDKVAGSSVLSAHSDNKGKKVQSVENTKKKILGRTSLKHLPNRNTIPGADCETKLNTNAKSSVSLNNEDCEKNLKLHRSRLETPSSGAGESIKSFARNRKEKFLENYRKSHERPYDLRTESDHYSEPREIVKEKLATNNAYTSVSSSDFFVSSASISLVCTNSSSTTTTTHQYDTRVGIATQTSNSLLRTVPIFGRKTCKCNNPFRCLCPKKTIRSYEAKSNKEAQVKPDAEAYIITFYKPNSKSKSVSSENLTIQELLNKNNPEFSKRANERQDILKKIHKLRYERESQIRDIIQNTSMNSIPRKLEQLPPPPTKYTRIFPTKEMKAITRRKYAKLPEVIEKAEREKSEKKRRSNKVFTDMFNKRLQRRVHKGKLSLEHSMTII